MVCASAGCGRPATRHHRWRRWTRVERTGPRGGRRLEWAPEGELVEADYCEDCSHSAWLGGLDDVSPPWPLAAVIPLRRRAS
jgi:hypothetical protein